MPQEEKKPVGPDLTKGIPFNDVPEGGTLIGHVNDDDVVLVRVGDEVFAISPHCTHYHGPLAEGLVVDKTVRCPWHHACFDLRTGVALRAPALDPITCWKVDRQDGTLFVRQKLERVKSKSARHAGDRPDRVVVIGSGAAGFAAAEMLRRQGYQNQIVMVSSDDALPYDRPSLSKDFLAGSIPFRFVPLKSERFYTDNDIETRLGQAVLRLDVDARQVVLASGDTVPYDRLLLATGAEPVRLTVEGADQSHIHTLRSLTDCRAIIERAKVARRAVVIGASFIGLEVAASLSARKLEVHVVGPGKRPMEHVLGPQLGDFIRALHEKHGVVFHLEDRPAAFEDSVVRLERGSPIEADLVVLGVGVRPRLELAEQAGLKLDRGVAVNEYLETSVPGIYAAGDIARWPDAHSGEAVRIEHWVVAERQGQTVALNMLGQQTPFTAVPFFWSQHYDVRINYVGHAESWDEITVEGDIFGKDCLVRFKGRGRVLAVASIFRDRESLLAEVSMERLIPHGEFGLPAQGPVSAGSRRTE
jgi:NADPH-dependent 2,4-dienoyl-CoA reductase/sulfur reductase-like enzyme/nitrite reductase/ring-hydroxylating ferredoxin subunit